MKVAERLTPQHEVHALGRLGSSQTQDHGREMFSLARTASTNDGDVRTIGLQVDRHRPGFAQPDHGSQRMDSGPPGGHLSSAGTVEPKYLGEADPRW